METEYLSDKDRKFLGMLHQLGFSEETESKMMEKYKKSPKSIFSEITQQYLNTLCRGKEYAKMPGA